MDNFVAVEESSDLDEDEDGTDYLASFSAGGTGNLFT